MRDWPTVDEEEAELERAMERQAASRVAGAIGRSLDDAYEAYRARLARAVADLQEASTVQD